MVRTKQSKRNRRSRALVCACAGVLAVTGCASGQRSRSLDQPDISKRPSGLEKTALRERALEMLNGFSFDENPLLRANAIEAMQVVPSRAEPVAAAGLGDKNPGVRYSAAMTIGTLQLRGIAPQVKALLRDKDARVRCAAIYALARCGETVNRSPLAGYLLGRDMRVSSTAAFVLGELGEPSAIVLLRDVARPPRQRDPAEAKKAPPVGRPDSVERVIRRLQVAEALVKLGEDSARDVVRSALYPRQREDFEAAVLAAQILGELQDTTAVAQLVQLVEQTVPGASKGKGEGTQYIQPKELRLAASTALAKLGYRDGVYVADAYRDDQAPAVRAQAAFLYRASGRWGDLETLTEMMDDPSPLVAVSAAAGVLAIMER